MQSYSFDHKGKELTVYVGDWLEAEKYSHHIKFTGRIRDIKHCERRDCNNLTCPRVKLFLKGGNGKSFMCGTPKEINQITIVSGVKINKVGEV